MYYEFYYENTCTLIQASNLEESVMALREITDAPIKACFAVVPRECSRYVRQYSVFKIEVIEGERITGMESPANLQAQQLRTKQQNG